MKILASAPVARNQHLYINNSSGQTQRLYLADNCLRVAWGIHGAGFGGVGVFDVVYRWCGVFG